MRMIIFGLSYLYFLILLELLKQDLLALDALRLRWCTGEYIHIDSVEVGVMLMTCLLDEYSAL